MTDRQQIRNSNAYEAFKKDLAAYQRATGKATNEVIATKALDFSIRFSKIMKKLAPSAQDINKQAENRDYRVRVRKRVIDQPSFKGSFEGKTRSKAGNKRALAVKKELAIRRSSVKWFSLSVAKWRKSLNKNLDEGKLTLGKSIVKGSEVGITRGSFTKKKDRVVVKSRALGLRKAKTLRRKVRDEAFREASKDINQFLGKRIGREFKKNIKKNYR